jgi:small subunit ribosomal protein S4
LGNIKKQRKTYNLPFKKWDKTRADDEDTLVHEFGLANKKEVWKANAKVSKFRTIAKTLFSKSGPIAEKTKKDLIDKAHRLGLLSVENATLDDLLGLTTKNILERRLQTMVLRKGFANTPLQARQFIAHGHILIGERVVTVPGYLVKKEEEALMAILPRSAIADSNHPARMTPQKKEEARLLEELRKKKAAETAEGAIEEKDVEEIEKVPEDE